MPYELVVKPTFTNQLLVIPPKFMAQILEKINVLRDDPSPHEPLKKKLHGVKGDIYRLRSGDFRIIYTYGNGIVTLVGVDDRKDVYKHELLVIESPTIAASDVPDVDELLAPIARPTAPTYQPKPPTAAEPLPRVIDVTLLEQLRIPVSYQKTLLACKTLDDLYAVNVPDTIRTAVFDVVTTPNYEQALTSGPDYVVSNVDDLLRYKEGDLAGFLLKLSADQERYVTWAINASGPTLVKGGPGTGKSTVALYRVRELLRVLRANGIERPKILFTTYTTALANYSRDLLMTLLGDDIDRVEVRNYDKLVNAIYRKRHNEAAPASLAEQRRALATATEQANYSGNPLQQKAQEATIEKLGEDYLLDELNTLITARQLDSLAAYQATPRPGRMVALNATQRMAVWAVYEQYVAALASLGRVTWEQMRAEAEQIVQAGEWPECYDAVVVDEAQDLDPSVLRMLVHLCQTPNHFFLTADANQSIYGAGFTWSDVHADLKFKGRTSILRKNFRSTRQISQAADNYLSGGELDSEELVSAEYVNEGPLPAVRACATGANECELLARFLPGAAKRFALGRGACAVLTPSTDAGKAIAAELTVRGVKATFMASANLDLRNNDVKVLTLKAAKGLEFPVVALAGFLSAPYPKPRPTIDEDEWQEILQRERRTMYVGMTRAMRALLVSVPADTTSPLLVGFAEPYWNCGAVTTEQS